MHAEIQTILVPAGAEYRAVKRALGQSGKGPKVVAIPAGPQPVRQFLEAWEDRSQLQGNLLLIGLGGSLFPEYGAGDGVLIEQVWNGYESGNSEIHECDRALTTQLAEQLGITTGVGVTCDRVITTAAEKRELRDRYGADVVDMEAAALLQALPHRRIAILRIISDDCHHDLPNISNAIGANGAIAPVPLGLSFLSHPVAAIRLIRGSLKGLKSLETVVSALRLKSMG
ncbi:hypothetical protein IQ241_16015 [Romeria aff. gracilis LEGE 07310]|uniref:Nucleoside phosphorylase domain-containing protein n=1 Tax=Vasconcelosia minhoensis LEGE 07310 TaxID=915328 RepID=A0A8J7DRL0_9CYAN|nr:hypothetical protein [Romeria gracilis]MBE9078784.1 hypothetical protein [Romeria aff. gracilis LEGE 07310]